MEYLILMTIAGSALCLAYVGWDRLFHGSLTQCMRFRALKFTLLVYVVPWVWLKDIYGFMIKWLLPVRVPEMIGHPVAMADIITEEEAYVTSDYRWHILIIVVWLAVALIMLSRKWRDYTYKRNWLLSMAPEITEGPVKETLEVLRKELHCMRRIRVYRTPIKGETFTLGAIRPLIFLQEEYKDTQLYFILKHEVTHVVRKDLVLKLFMEFACCLHWFNYFVHALNKKFDKVCEYSCDERVLKGCTREVCLAYTRLLADNFSQSRRETEERIKIPFRSGLNDDLDEMVERMTLIKEAKEIKSWKKWLTGSVFAVILVANSLVALAYPDIYHVEESDTEFAISIVDGNTFWIHDNNLEFKYDYPITDMFCDSEFIDEEGNTHPVNMLDSHEKCIQHDIISGKYQVHVRSDNGGCTVMTYQSTRCKICTSVWIGEWINTSSCAECPH